MAVRILVADPDPVVQRAIDKVLAQAGFEVVLSAEGSKVLALARTERPDLIIVSANLPGTDWQALVTTVRSAEATGTHTPIIVLLDQDQPALPNGLRSGADDSLTKPFRAAELMARIRSLLARYRPAEVIETPVAVVRRAAPAGRTARLILFYGAKGGVGTTTLAINTAIALHRDLGHRVCLIDGNIQFGDLRVFLDLPLDRMSMVELATSPSRDLELVNQVTVEHESGIHLLLSPPSPEMADLVTSELLPEIIGLLTSEFDYIVIDIDKRLDEFNLRLMDLASSICVVMVADLPCLKNVRHVLETIGHLGYSADKVRLVLNRSNALTGISVKNAESALKRRVDFQIPSEYRLAVRALNSGTPVMTAADDSALGRSILEFARALDKDLDENPASTRGRG